MGNDSPNMRKQRRVYDDYNNILLSYPLGDDVFNGLAIFGVRVKFVSSRCRLQRLIATRCRPHRIRVATSKPGQPPNGWSAIAAPVLQPLVERDDRRAAAGAEHDRVPRQATAEHAPGHGMGI